MPIYQLRCPAGHGFEVIQSFTAPLPPCPQCGCATAKVPSVFGLGGQAGRSLPPPPEAMPQTWRGTHQGNPEYLASLRRTAERRRELEERNPELAGDRRPILAHEGQYESTPLRFNDPVPPGPRHSPGQEHAQKQGHPPGAAPATPTRKPPRSR